MRPYLTILRDSFHEALASRVLWMILIVITILLVFIAPLGLRGLEGPQLDVTEVFDPPALARAILEGAEKEGPSVGKRILEQLPKDSRTRIEAIADEKAMIGAPATTAQGSSADWLAQQLNPLLAKPDFYDADAWKKVRLRSEARKMHTEGLDKLSAKERERFNRLAFEAAFPQKVAMLANRQEKLAYFGFTPEILPEAKRADLQVAIGYLIFVMLKFGVGVAGVLAGLFVTSTIIPQTFEAGAVDLLFSKPVGRTGVYLTKFFGGCAFVVIMAVYFIGGIWLLAGWRFGIWNNYLLATAPVFVFVFAVYFSVSALAGAYWRNPIVAVTMAVLLWGAGWTLSIINGFADAYITTPDRILKVVATDDAPLSVAELGQVRVWDAASNSWREVFKPAREETAGFGIRMPTPFAGPLYDPPNKRIVAVDRGFPGPGRRPSAQSLLVGAEQDDFVRQVAVTLPANGDSVNALLREPDSSFLIVSSAGVQRWQGKIEEQQAAPTTIAGFDVSGVFGGRGKAPSDALTLVAPRGTLEPSYQAAVNAKTGELAMLDESVLSFQRKGEDGKFAVRLETDVDLPDVGPIAFAGDTLLVALEDRRVIAFNPDDGKPRDALSLPGESGPNTMFASPDGKTFAILTRDRHVYLYDPAEHSLAEADMKGQGNITAISIGEKGELLVADRADRVSVYALPGLAGVARYQPSRTWLRFAYDFLLYPIYRVTPKPRELDQLTMSLISDLDQAPNMDVARDADISAPQESNKWIPVRDNAIFIVLMLALGCWYVSRRDF
jgi:hypothetical protein